MSAPELMKKHYIIQQEVFREKKTIGLSLNLQTLKARLKPVRRPGSLSTEVDLAAGRLVLSGGRSKAIHRRFVLSTGDTWAIRSLTLTVKGDSSAIRPKHGRNVADSFSHTAGQSHFISFHFISFHFISFHFISFHFISFHFISFHFISFHFISFHFISFHFISFHFISFHFI